MYCSHVGCWHCTPCPTHVEGRWRAIVLGSGGSGGIPRLACALRAQPFPCVCQAVPFDEKNRRGNPCLLLQRMPVASQGVRSDGRLNGESALLIDVGKTFRESACQWLPKFAVRAVDSVLFTHHHADAIMGADELRELLPPSDRMHEAWADANTCVTLREVFPYIFKSAEEKVVQSSLSFAQMRLRELEPHRPFVPISDLQVTALPMHHGQVESQGFAIHQEGDLEQLVYLSDFRNKPQHGTEVTAEDISRLSFFVNPELALQTLKKLPVSTLFVDCWHPTRVYVSHPALPETIAVIRALEAQGVCARRVYLVGMCCVMDYSSINAILLKEFPSGHVQLAYDGLEIPLSFPVEGLARL